jgi:rod shape-determining protein MreC
MFDLRRHRAGLIIFLLILCAGFSIYLQLGSRSAGDTFHSVGLQIVAPFQHAFHWGVNSVHSVFNNYAFLINVRRENRQLQEEVSRLRRENNDLRESAQGFERLRNLLLLKERFRLTMITAEVLASSPSAWPRTIVINKGERDGIKKDMPVATWEGLVGRILRASPHTAVVLLIIDRNSAVDAVVQRTRTQGILEGEGGVRCSVRYVARGEDVKIGDTIITSGMEGVFPKGLSLGEVVRIVKKDYGLFQQIEVTPSVHFSRLEEVMVIVSPVREREG